jgi:hypothetical protein
MSQEDYSELRSRGTDRVPNPAAVALGRLALGHKKTLTNAERARRRAFMEKLNKQRANAQERKNENEA